ncbi:hypothetical protein VNO77_03464 [Canavalia gladiata]|uniref:Uncharacterized protein n=1 Tax=Canavalia gladiata TaxID=3824 RepID=A0AAN9MWS3_CANGL
MQEQAENPSLTKLCGRAQSTFLVSPSCTRVHHWAWLGVSNLTLVDPYINNQHLAIPLLPSESAGISLSSMEARKQGRLTNEANKQLRTKDGNMANLRKLSGAFVSRSYAWMVVVCGVLLPIFRSDSSSMHRQR